MKNEQEIVRNVFDAYIRDAKAISTKKDRPTFDILEEVKNRAIKALEQQPSDDCVSRQAVIDYLYTNMAWYDENGSIADDSQKLRDITNLVNGVPSVTPTHGTCKDCQYRDLGSDICDIHEECVALDFYCADFEKRGSESGL